MTFRAVEILKHADLIAAEDTRNSGRLLTHFAIQTPQLACHEHNEQQVSTRILQALSEGKRVALISDAGTPLINDPGYRLVRQAREAGFPVLPVPGACSPIAALSVSGLPTDQFTYLGFLPRSGQARAARIARVIESDATVVLLESPHRLLKTLHDLEAAGLGERELFVGREMTKRFEEYMTGTALSLQQYFSEHVLKGELVLAVAPADKAAPDGEAEDELILVMLQGEEMQALPPSQRAKAVAKKLGVEKARVYALMTAGH